MTTITMKFGGTSVGNADAIAQVADIIEDAYRQQNRVLVVCSAMSKVTDMLIEGARRAATGDSGALSGAGERTPQQARRRDPRVC